MLRRAAAAGFPVARLERPAILGGEAQTVLYVSRDLARAEQLRDAEAGVLPGGPVRPPTAEVLAAHRVLGAGLGYPPCCVDAFLARLARGVTRARDGGEAHEDFVAAEDAASRTGVFHGRLNHLRFHEQVKVVSFYPCRYDCPEALALAGRLHDLVRARDPAAAEALARRLAEPLAVGRHAERLDPAAAGPDAQVLPFNRF